MVVGDGPVVEGGDEALLELSGAQCVELLLEGSVLLGLTEGGGGPVAVGEGTVDFGLHDLPGLRVSGFRTVAVVAPTRDFRLPRQPVVNRDAQRQLHVLATVVGELPPVGNGHVVSTPRVGEVGRGPATVQRQRR